MKRRTGTRAVVAGVALSLLLGGAAFGAEEMAGMKKQETQKLVAKHKAWLEQHVKDWPEKTKGVIATTVEKYGPPHEMTASMLIWKDTGPWKMSVISKEEVAHDFPKRHKDVLEQFIDYKVPVDKYDDLARYDGSVIAERTKGVLSARCDLEEANFLAINLANDVATGKKSAEQARSYYATAMAKMMKAGTMDPYMTGLRFRVASGGTGDADKPAPEMMQGMGGSGMEGEHQHHPSMPKPTE